MGKIYDALKQAEKEAEINKGKKHFPDNEQPRLIKGRVDAQKAPSSQPIAEKIPLTKRNIIKDFSLTQLLKRKEKDTNQGIRKNLFVIDDPHSIAAEQFRIIKSRILSFCKDNNLRTILVTSCLPGEGKSTVSANLALSIANSINEHALLLDCDLRRPSIHKIFNLANGKKGLAEYLSADIPLVEILNKSQSEKLTIIPAGNTPNNPSELLSSAKMLDLIQELKSTYDDRYIIFDSTPAFQTPEPVILAKQIDCIILVVKAGNANREVVKRVVESFPKKKIIGIVFNMINEPIKSYYYNNYYYSKQNS